MSRGGPHILSSKCPHRKCLYLPALAYRVPLSSRVSRSFAEDNFMYEVSSWQPH